jgi:glycine dehydrogenase
MIPLGSCTMKLNATSEMVPVGWPEFSKLHPVRSDRPAQGYVAMNERMESMAGEITGFRHVACSPTLARRANTAGCS